MKAVLENPYRILGLLAGATAREQDKQINKLKRIVEAGDIPPKDDYCFSELSKLTRSIETIEEAEKKLHLDSDKINAALFWFWNGNPITDNEAFEALKEGYEEQAYQIWDNLISEIKYGEELWKPITIDNCSAFHNCFVLEMLRKNGNKQIAIVANLHFLGSEFSQKFIYSIADSTFKTSPKELQINFLNEILQEIGKKTINFTLDNLVSVLNSAEFTAKDDFLKNISQKFTSNISAQTDIAKRKRIVSKFDAARAGEELYQQTRNDLEQLKSLIGVENFIYSNIADKVASEILQCGVDFFNQHKDNSTDPSNTSMRLIQKAKNMAVGTLCKQRCDENIEGLRKWIDNKPIREKERQIEFPLKFITDKLRLFKSQSKSIDNARELIVSCKPKLDEIKVILGTKDDYYLQLSSAVVGSAQSMLVTVVNEAQDGYNFYLNPYERYGERFH